MYGFVKIDALYSFSRLRGTYWRGAFQPRRRMLFLESETYMAICKILKPSILSLSLSLSLSRSMIFSAQ